LLFPFLMTQMPTPVAGNIDACVNATNTIQTIGAADATTDDYIFLALIAFAKIGTILSFYNGNGTATVNTNYDACTIAGARAMGGQITDADAREIGTGITLALAGLQAVAGKINLGAGSLTQMQNICTTLNSPPFNVNLCGITNPASFTALEVKAIRSLVKENTVLGLGLTQANGSISCPGDVTNCFCP